MKWSGGTGAMGGEWALQILQIVPTPLGSVTSHVQIRTVPPTVGCVVVVTILVVTVVVGEQSV